MNVFPLKNGGLNNIAERHVASKTPKIAVNVVKRRVRVSVTTAAQVQHNVTARGGRGSVRHATGGAAGILSQPPVVAISVTALLSQIEAARKRAMAVDDDLTTGRKTCQKVVAKLLKQMSWSRHTLGQLKVQVRDLRNDVYSEEACRPDYADSNWDAHGNITVAECAVAPVRLSGNKRKREECAGIDGAQNPRGYKNPKLEASSNDLLWPVSMPEEQAAALAPFLHYWQRMEVQRHNEGASVHKHHTSTMEAHRVQIAGLDAEEKALVEEKALLEQAIANAAARALAAPKPATVSCVGALDPDTFPSLLLAARERMAHKIVDDGVFRWPDEPSVEADLSNPLSPEDSVFETVGAAYVQAVPPKRRILKLRRYHFGMCSDDDDEEEGVGGGGSQGGTGTWTLEKRDEQQHRDLADLDFTNESCWTFEPMVA